MRNLTLSGNLAPGGDSGVSGGCAIGVAFDGRGFSRPWDIAPLRNGAGDGCDTGAFEFIDQDEDGIEVGIDCDDLDPTNVCSVFADGFESGDTAGWSTTVGAR